MVKEFRKAILVALAVAALITACAPAQTTTPEQVQGMVATSVEMTVQAQNGMADAVAQTLTAQAPVPMATATVVAPSVPTTDPALATATPFVVVPPPSGSTGGSSDPAPAKYQCSWREVKPRINVFHPGDNFNVQWVITNTGTATWPSALDFNFYAGTAMSTYAGQELPALKPDDTVTISFDAIAPNKPGFYSMEFKVQGGLCFPALNVEVGKPKDP